MAYRDVFELQKPWTVELVRCINEWANGHWDAKDLTWKNPYKIKWMNHWTMGQWIDDPVKQWIDDSTKQWINESMHECFSESIKQWTNEWFDEPMHQWINESLAQWINESRNAMPINQRINESMNQWMKEWMDEWNGWMGEVFFLLSYFFTERPLCWGTSSLSYFFSELLCSFCNPSLLFAQLLYNAFTPAAIPHRTGVALWSRIAFRAAVTMHLATSSCNPAC